jgi:hypothetical protein
MALSEKFRNGYGKSNIPPSGKNSATSSIANNDIEKTHIYDGKPLSEMDLWDLRNSLAHSCRPAEQAKELRVFRPACVRVERSFHVSTLFPFCSQLRDDPVHGCGLAKDHIQVVAI